MANTSTTEPAVEQDENITDAEIVVQPGDIEDADEQPQTEEQQERSKEVERVVTARMDLTLDGNSDPNALSPAQVAGLKAIVNFDLAEPGAWPQTIAFMHMCVKRGLDPFAREAYLIARGREGTSGRKWTMQTGIDGYRVIAARTGKFIRVKARLWTGADDDDKSWRLDPNTGVMQRVWWDFWPDSRGFPGAAKVIVEHYDDRGFVTNTEFIANWEMYCPLYEEWEDKPGGGRRKTGKKAPGEMWVKGGSMMLAKCAEASALRSAIPGGLNGLYIHEEMHRADAIEQDRHKAEAAQRIITAHATRVAQPVPAAAAQQQPDPEPAGQPGEAPAGPLLNVGQPEAQETPAEPQQATQEPEQEQAGESDAPTPEQALTWLREEIGFQAAVLDKKVEDLVARQMDAAGVEQPGDLTAEDLGEVVFTQRRSVVAALRRKDRGAEADAYERWQTDQIGPVAVLTGRATTPQE